MKWNGWWLGMLLMLLVPELRAELVVNDAYMRELPPGAAVGAVFLTLRNTGPQPRRLLAVSSPLAARAEVHTHIHDGGQMRMRPVEEVRVPAGGEIEFKPGGYHIMLFGMQRALKEGDSLPLALKFANGEQITLTALVRKY